MVFKRLQPLILTVFGYLNIGFCGLSTDRITGFKSNPERLAIPAVFIHDIEDR